MSIKLTETEIRVLQYFQLSERDSRRFTRTIDDIANLCGYSFQEVFEFLQFGAETEREELIRNYDWERFKRQIVRKLKKRN